MIDWLSFGLGALSALGVCGIIIGIGVCQERGSRDDYDGHSRFRDRP